MISKIEEYALDMREKIEKPRNELREKVYGEGKMEYQPLLEKYEEEYLDSCLKIEEMIEEEYNRRKNG